MTKIVVPNVIANGYSIASAMNLPEIRAEWADETVYELLIESVTGAPSTGTLAAKWQRWCPVGAGNVWEASGQWLDLSQGDPTHPITTTTDLTASVKYVSSFEFGETSGTAVAGLQLRDGSGGTVIADVRLLAGGSFGMVYPPDRPLHFPTKGLYVQSGSGAFRGSVIGTVDNVHPQLPGGDWPVVLADQTLAAPKAITRTIKGGFRHRLVLTPTFSGGTAPAFVVSCMAYTRG